MQCLEAQQIYFLTFSKLINKHFYTFLKNFKEYPTLESYLYHRSGNISKIKN